MVKFLRILGVPALGVLLSGAVSAEPTKIPVSQREAGIRLVERTADGLTFRVTLGELVATEVETEEGTFTRLKVAGAHRSREWGRPELPVVNRLFEIPAGAEVTVEVVGFETGRIALADFGLTHALMPSQPSVFKDQDPRAVPFHYDRSTYALDRPYELPLARAHDGGRLRDVRVGRLEVAPVSYNPGTGTITVRENIEIAVRFTRGDRKDPDPRPATYSPFFEPVYGTLAGYKTPHDDHPDLLDGPVTYLILSDPMFRTQLVPFVQWKTEQGFRVVEAYTDEPDVGTTTGSIQTFVHDLYDSATPENPAPTFVLFVGDLAQIPAFNLSGYSDLPYCDPTGDGIPDMYYGRFSAANTGDLAPQIEKTLEYERFEMPDPSFLGEAVMIAGMDAAHGYDWANGQINYATDHYVNGAHGIASETYLYPASGSHALDIVLGVTDGCALINYTAHGTSISWDNPGFTIPDVSNLGNAHEYCLAIGNCCLTSSFQVTNCFAEHWLRVADKGAIGYIGAAAPTLWDEDYYWAVGYGPVVSGGATYEETGLGAYDGMFHDHGEDIGRWYVVQDAYIFCGNLAVQASGSVYTDYYWEAYNLMGDPSLSVYLGVPDSNQVALPDSIRDTDTELVVTAEPKSYVGVSKDGVLLGGGLVGESGTASIPISGQGDDGTVRVVVTCQNKIPHRVDLPVAASSEICLTLTPDELDFGTIAQGYHATQPILLQNGCAHSLDWSVTGKPDWVSLDLEEGTLGAGRAAQTVYVSIDTGVLESEHSYTDRVTFQSTDNPCTLTVSVDVDPPVISSPPVISFPTDSVAVATLTPNLVVENAVGPGSLDTLWYHFEIDTAYAFSSAVRQASPPVPEGESTTQWQTADLIENALWFWRSWCSEDGASTDTTGIGVFYVNAVNECPEPFDLVSPPAGSTLVARRPVFGWEAAADPDPLDEVTYRVYVGAGGEWDSVGVGTALTLEWPADLSDNTAYLWKVQAVDQLKCATWSAEWGFVVNEANEPPSVVSLSLPDSGSVASTLRPTFQWTAAADPDPLDEVTYGLWYGQDSLFQDPGRVDSVWVGSDVEYEPGTDLDDNAIYFWRVAAKDGEGARSWSPVWRFAANTRAPEFTFVLLQNPFLERYLDLYAVPSESLRAEPEVTFTVGDSLSVVTLSRMNTDVPVYHADFRIPASGCGRAELWACDVADLCVSDTAEVCAVFAKAGAQAALSTPDGRAELVLSGQSLTRDRVMTALPWRGSLGGAKGGAGIPGVEAGSSEDPGTGRRWGVGCAYAFGPSGAALGPGARLVVEYAADDLRGEPEWKLGLFRLDGGAWTRVEGGQIEPGRVSAPVDRLGIYQLQLDPDWVPLPTSYCLRPNYPNPFNPSTTIEYDLAGGAAVTLRIYGVDGRLVRELVRAVQPAGRYSVAWDGTDEAGRRVASGVYFLRMAGPDFAETRRLVLLK